MVLSSLGKTMTPEQVMAGLPVNKDPDGNELGTLNQELATWCIKQGYKVTMYSADFQILDLLWSHLEKDMLLERMKLALGHHHVANLSDQLSDRYLQSYIDFIEAGGELHIEQYMSSRLLDQLLNSGPLVAAVSYFVLWNCGRVVNPGLRENQFDDIDGHLGTHSIVIYGKDDTGKYMVADPWMEPGLHTVESELLLAAMTSSETECDNLIFQLEKLDR